ncbi:hypothetical protein ACWGLP_36635 [Streptomyces lydicus]
MPNPREFLRTPVSGTPSHRLTAVAGAGTTGRLRTAEYDEPF